MQQFVVPQFIDVEDKIFGPITTRQFLIILVGGLLLFLEFKLSLSYLSFGISAFFTIVIFGGLAFVKYNGMPLHYFLLNILQNLKRPKLRVWQRVDDMATSKDTDSDITNLAPTLVTHSSLSKSRLQHLTLLIDTGGAYQPDQDELDLNAKQK